MDNGGRPAGAHLMIVTNGTVALRSVGDCAPPSRVAPQPITVKPDRGYSCRRTTSVHHLAEQRLSPDRA